MRAIAAVLGISFMPGGSSLAVDTDVSVLGLVSYVAFGADCDPCGTVLSVITSDASHTR
jgi:hypothetical protein